MYPKMLLACVLFVFVVSAASRAQAQQTRVRIDSPSHQGAVEQMEIVQGTVTGSQDEVWVIVRPTATRDYWVQPKSSHDGDGKWSAPAYFGRPGRDYGARFQVAALVNPTRPLREGMVFNGWPRAQVMSPIITVTRR